MSVEIFDVAYDSVIRSNVGIGKTTYGYALQELYPLVDRLESQRKPLASRLYKKMQKDIVDGAILPPITLAFIAPNATAENKQAFEIFIVNHIEDGFILDGIQRLSALKRISEEAPSLLGTTINWDTPLYINVVISPSRDNLLYRMITLNNGQKPMSPRHQIEALTDFSIKSLATNIKFYTEKTGNINNGEISFKKSSVVKSYIAFMMNNYLIDNSKIIESKMDELIAEKIMENQKSISENEFSDILSLIGRLSENERVHDWFSVENNMIGFCSAIRDSFNQISSQSPSEFAAALLPLESYMTEWLEPSKIKLGLERRKSVHAFIKQYDEYKCLQPSQLVELFAAD